eukprot:749601-Hanusia_phi.AAC.2
MNVRTGEGSRDSAVSNYTLPIPSLYLPPPPSPPPPPPPLSPPHFPMLRAILPYTTTTPHPTSDSGAPQSEMHREDRLIFVAMQDSGERTKEGRGEERGGEGRRREKVERRRRWGRDMRGIG